MNSIRKNFLNDVRQAIKNHVYARMNVATVSHRGAEKGQPDQKITGELLCPEKGVIKYITAKNLNRNNQGHGKTKPEKRIFNPLVYDSAQPFKKVQCASIS